MRYVIRVLTKHFKNFPDSSLGHLFCSKDAWTWAKMNLYHGRSVKCPLCKVKQGSSYRTLGAQWIRYNPMKRSPMKIITTKCRVEVSENLMLVIELANPITRKHLERARRLEEKRYRVERLSNSLSILCGMFG